MDVSEAKRLMAPEEENAKLKKLLTEQCPSRASFAHLRAVMSLSERLFDRWRGSEDEPLSL